MLCVSVVNYSKKDSPQRHRATQRTTETNFPTYSYEPAMASEPALFHLCLRLSGNCPAADLHTAGRRLANRPRDPVLNLLLRRLVLQPDHSSDRPCRREWFRDKAFRQQFLAHAPGFLRAPDPGHLRFRARGLAVPELHPAPWFDVSGPKE